MIKKCSKCKQELSFDKFDLDKRKKFGLQVQCKECRKKHRKEYLATEHGKAINKLQTKRWSITEKGKEYTKDYLKKYRQENKEKIAKLRKKWLKTPKGKIHALNYVHRRLALIEHNGGYVSNEAMYNLFNKAIKCPICKKEFSDTTKKSLDHILPLSKGGKHEISNLQILCLKCNFIKGDR